MKTYVAVLNYESGIVNMYVFDGGLEPYEVEVKISVWHNMKDIYYMMRYEPIEIFLNNTINATPDYD